jgi:hypothetical protein
MKIKTKYSGIITPNTFVDAMIIHQRLLNLNQIYRFKLKSSIKLIIFRVIMIVFAMEMLKKIYTRVLDVETESLL